MEKHHKFSMWYVLLGIWVVLIIQNALFSAFSVKTIAYSEFLKALNENRVTEVAITSNMIQGRMKDSRASSDQGELFRTVRVDPEISGLLSGHDVKFKGEVESTFARDLLSWVIPIFLFVGIWYFMMKRMQGQQPGFMSLGKNKAKIYMQDEVGVRFDDVAGVEESKQELKEVIEFLKEPGRFTAIGGQMPRGVLLVGPPGTGKTLLAKAVAGESGVPFFSMSGSEFVEMFVGLGAARVRDLFTQAKAKAPCIIFIDELDALGKARGIGTMGGHDEREQTLNQMLVEMDGFDVTGGVILIAATNRPDILDPALLRPGRFDRQIQVSPPDLEGRFEVLKVHARGKPMAPDVDLHAVARRTPGFTGADLANVLNEAALLTARSGSQLIDNRALDEAIDRVIAGPQKRTRVMDDKEKLITAYHEGGHALVAAALPGNDPVHKITILPRGRALGYTMVLPDQDKYSTTRSEMLNQLAYMLGGRAAEELVFHDPTTGAANDIEKATAVARAMVTQYGMTERLGAIRYGKEDGEVFLGRDMGHMRDYSEEIAAVIDEEVRGLIDQAHNEAFETLVDNRDVLDDLVVALLEKETLNKEQVAEIFETLRRRPARPAWTGSERRAPSDRPPVEVPPRPEVPAGVGIPRAAYGLPAPGGYSPPPAPSGSSGLPGAAPAQGPAGHPSGAVGTTGTMPAIPPMPPPNGGGPAGNGSQPTWGQVPPGAAGQVPPGAAGQGPGHPGAPSPEGQQPGRPDDDTGTQDAQDEPGGAR